VDDDNSNANEKKSFTSNKGTTEILSSATSPLFNWKKQSASTSGIEMEPTVIPSLPSTQSNTYKNIPLNSGPDFSTLSSSRNPATLEGINVLISFYFEVVEFAMVS
jgi:hypothetical protein